jgi:hypothetical protein
MQNIKNVRAQIWREAQNRLSTAVDSRKVTLDVRDDVYEKIIVSTRVAIIRPIKRCVEDALDVSVRIGEYGEL